MYFNIANRKVRGLRRKYNKLEARLLKNTNLFPKCSDSYWHLHMPCSNLLLNSSKVKKRYKQRIVHLLFDIVDHLIQLKPDNEFCKVVCCIDSGDLWMSQIIIFFSQEYFDSFFTRTEEWQRWIVNQNVQNFINTWNVNRDANRIIGFHQIVKDEDSICETDLWFYGDIST